MTVPLELWYMSARRHLVPATGDIRRDQRFSGLSPEAFAGQKRKSCLIAEQCIAWHRPM